MTDICEKANNVHSLPIKKQGSQLGNHVLSSGTMSLCISLSSIQNVSGLSNRPILRHSKTQRSISPDRIREIVERMPFDQEWLEADEELPF